MFFFVAGFCTFFNLKRGKLDEILGGVLGGFRPLPALLFYFFLPKNQEIKSGEGSNKIPKIITKFPNTPPAKNCLGIFSLPIP